MQRPIIARIEEENLNLTLQMSDKATLSGATVSFFTPNNVSIFLSSAKKELSKSNLYIKVFLEKYTKPNIKTLKFPTKTCRDSIITLNQFRRPLFLCILQLSLLQIYAYHMIMFMKKQCQGNQRIL